MDKELKQGRVRTLTDLKMTQAELEELRENDIGGMDLVEDPKEYWIKQRLEEGRMDLQMIANQTPLEQQPVSPSPPPPPGRRPRILRRPDVCERVPVQHVRRRLQGVGIDLICDTCQYFIAKSFEVQLLCHFYYLDPSGSPLTRCYFWCPNCNDDIELGRNNGDADNFRVIGGATKHVPPSSKLEDTTATNLENEAYPYPDVMLDSRYDIPYTAFDLQKVKEDNDDDMSGDDDNDTFRFFRKVVRGVDMTKMVLEEASDSEEEIREMDITILSHSLFWGRLPSIDPLRRGRQERKRIERVGLDLMCNSCHQQISKSERLPILCHFYPREGRANYPLTRCYVRCTNCPSGIVLGRNIGTPDDFVVLSGAIQQVPPDTVPNSEAKNQNEDYPDAPLDSPDDYQTPYTTSCAWEESRFWE